MTKVDCKRPWKVCRPISDGEVGEGKHHQHLPGEVVSTPDRIPLIIRYFQKIIVLIRKKPVNLAGVKSRGKNRFGTVRFPD
jgi:hypothetical protein